MTEHYDINRLFIEREDLYSRTKLHKGDPRRLTLPKAKRIASQEHHSHRVIGTMRLTAAQVADRYIARVQP